MKYLIALFLLVIIGCTTPQDMTPPPINHNKMTLEMAACDKQEVGLLGCFYNQDLSKNLRIPLWYKGEYQIRSERCNFFENSRYENSEELEFTYEKLIANKPENEKTCLFNIKVFIDKFDNGFQGFFLLSEGNIKALEFNLSNQNYLGYAGIQIKEGQTLLPNIAIKAKTKGLVFWEGCKVRGEKKYQSDPTINISEIIGDIAFPLDTCILTIGLIPSDVQLPVELAKIHINIFEKVIVTLPQPSLEYKNEKLKVNADKIVAAIGIGNSLSVEYGNRKKSYKRNVKENEEVDVRIMTSNGRFMLLKVKNGEILWMK